MAMSTTDMEIKDKSLFGRQKRKDSILVGEVKKHREAMKCQGRRSFARIVERRVGSVEGSMAAKTSEAVETMATEVLSAETTATAETPSAETKKGKAARKRRCSNYSLVGHEGN